MANVLDIITLQQYYDFIEREQTSPSAQDDATTLGNRITQASSYLEQKAKRPLVPDSDIDVPTDDDDDEITKYQPYDSPTESASPVKTMPQELELAWLRDDFEGYFLHIQGSGYLAFPDTFFGRENQ